MARENRTGIFELPKDPELEDLFRVAFRKLQLELRTNTTARVIAYDPATQFVDVSTEILQVFKDLRTEPSQANPSPERLADPIILSGIPVAWPRTSSGYLTFPLNPGDTGELRVQDRSLQRWLDLGQAVDPISSWVQELGSGVFCPCLYPATNPIVPPTDQAAAVLEATLIKLGRGASSFIVKAELLDALDAFANAIPVVGDGGAALQTAFKAVYTIIRPMLSTTKVQAE